jgi:hypothetical protein
MPELAVELELGAREILENLLPARRAPRRGARSAVRAERELAERAPEGRRCRCGDCRTCRENARWERIFKEKFEDPTYYAHPPVRISSPLTDL